MENWAWQAPGLFISIFLAGMGFSIIMPVLPYYAESMGANAFQLGMLITQMPSASSSLLLSGAYSTDGRKPVFNRGRDCGFYFGYATIKDAVSDQDCRSILS